MDELMKRVTDIEDSLHLHAHKGYDLTQKLNGAEFIRPRVGGGGIVYEINDNGAFWFGDGSDGNVEITGDTTLTADKYYQTLQIKSGVTLSPAGYRIFVKDTCIVAGTISGNGNAGGAGGNGANGVTGPSGGTGGAAGTAGATLADGYLKGSLVGKAGKAGGEGGTAGGNGTAGTAGLARSTLGRTPTQSPRARPGHGTCSYWQPARSRRR